MPSKVVFSSRVMLRTSRSKTSPEDPTLLALMSRGCSEEDQDVATLWTPHSLLSMYKDLQREALRDPLFRAYIST
jgi:hypothetical protein